MGTSQSSSGAPSGVPLVPPWVPNPIVPENGGGGDTQNGPADQSLPPIPVAPARRFNGVRKSLGSFARSGSSDDMHRGLGHYVQGLGGGRVGVRRFGGTIRTAGTLYGALSALADRTAPPGSSLDPAILAGRSAKEIMDAVIEAVRPVDGTQDAEANRAAIRDALAELLTRFPNADLLNLSEEERVFAIERFTALDVFNRFQLDLGQAWLDKALSPAIALARLRDIRDYIKETVAAAFRKLRTVGERLSANLLAQIVQSSLQETLEVFLGYVV